MKEVLAEEDFAFHREIMFIPARLISVFKFLYYYELTT